MNTEGFYKNEDGLVVSGPNFVDNGSFTLYKELKDTYTYPIGGWYWFDSVEEAYTFFNLELPPQQNNEGQI